jgi:predicted transcriptional regulator
MSQTQQARFDFSTRLLELMEGYHKVSNAKDRVTLKIEISPELDDLLKELAEEANVTMADIFRHGIALYLVAVEAKKQGLQLGVVGPEQDVLLKVEGY